LKQLEKAPWLKRLAEGERQRRRLVSVYFDNDARDLKDNGVALRVRNIAGKRVQTIKSAGTVSRGEWEAEIAGDAPERRLAKGTALEDFSSRKAWRTLKPLFE